MILQLDKNFQEMFKDQTNLFDQIMAIDGKVYRNMSDRQTLQFTRNKKSYFIKKHFGVGWGEIFKNLFHLRLPIISAKSEYDAIQKLSSLGIITPKVIGFGEKGINPANKKSFLITEEITNHIGLRDLAQTWNKTKPDFVFKKNIIKEVATITKIMHENGINHRDLYLAHFLLDKSSMKSNQLKIFLFDPHRAQIRKKVPQRWLVKDLASLYFSSMEASLTKQDILRFVKYYFDQPLREILLTKRKLLKKIEKQARLLYRKKRI